jgi:hypothetical protein
MKSSRLLLSLLFAVSASFALGQCVTEPPECVDVDSEAYQLTVTLDSFCCDLTWDSICQNLYDNNSTSCSGGGPIQGCTDPEAYNYNPLAEVDNGSCYYPCPNCGCTDPLALNYDVTATEDDGSCIYPCNDCGCTDPDALNYDPNALTDDGSCQYPSGPSIVVEQEMSPDELVFDFLLGSGVLGSNVSFTGSAIQVGEFYEGDDIGMSSGIVMSTGHANDIELMTGQWSTVAGGIVGDPDLGTVANSVPALIGQAFSVWEVYDVCALEFDFIPFGDNVSFNYLFASNEYLAWVNTSFNDVFAFFLSGPGIEGPYANNAVNIATVPTSDPALPITVSSVNNVTNSQYFINNAPNTQHIDMQGYTSVFTASYSGLTPGQTYHIRLAIADGSDSVLDSVVLLQAGSFGSEVDANGSPADFNGDGLINVHDLLILLGDYGCVAPPDCIGDLNGDGEVNFEDILEFLSAFG